VRFGAVFLFCHRDFFFAVSSSYKVNEHPFVCHTRILGPVVIPSGTTGFLWPGNMFHVCWLVKRGKKAKEKKKENHFVLCLINFV
jgi:hypothetical protein